MTFRLKWFGICFVVMAIGLAFCAPAQAARICARSGACASVAPAHAGKFQCLVSKLERNGQRIKFMGGYGWRPFWNSKHKWGGALDINQYARNFARPAMIKGATRIASSCGLLHGAVWRWRDAAHFEVITAGRHSKNRHYARNRSWRLAQRQWMMN